MYKIINSINIYLLEWLNEKSYELIQAIVKFNRVLIGRSTKSSGCYQTITLFASFKTHHRHHDHHYHCHHEHCTTVMTQPIAITHQLTLCCEALKGQYHAIFSNTLKIGKTLFGC